MNDTGRKEERAGVVAVGVAVALANLRNRFAPLVLLSGADHLAVFPKAQLEAVRRRSWRPPTGRWWGSS